MRGHAQWLSGGCTGEGLALCLPCVLTSCDSEDPSKQNSIPEEFSDQGGICNTAWMHRDCRIKEIQSRQLQHTDLWPSSTSMLPCGYFAKRSDRGANKDWPAHDGLCGVSKYGFRCDDSHRRCAGLERIHKSDSHHLFIVSQA